MPQLREHQRLQLILTRTRNEARAPRPGFFASRGSRTIRETAGGLHGDADDRGPDRDGDAGWAIIPARGRVADKVFLPFDDDPTLSVILSKAFLLARDSKITDKSIVMQIRAR